jgi:hypothetical protein
MNRFGFFGTLAINAAAFTTSAALGEAITYTSQQRYVHAQYNNGLACGGGSVSQQINAPDFGVFDEQAVQNNQNASQFSTIEDYAISGEALCTAQATGCAGSATGAGTSHVNVVFEVTQPIEFNIAGSIGWVGFLSQSSVTLSGPAGDIHDFKSQGQTFNFSGTLQPGTHTITAHANAASQGGFATSATFEFALTFEPPACLGDVVPAEGDGVVDVDDLFGMLNAWGTSDPQFDLSPSGAPDGVIGIDDLFVLIGAWGACD